MARTATWPRSDAANAEEAQPRRGAGGASASACACIDRTTLRGWQRDGDRSVYLLDVRSPEEFEAGHLPGSLNAPGGQLVQATDRYVATLRARLVLIDDDGVRAIMTASWLNQLGLHDAVVLERGLLDAHAAAGHATPATPSASTTCDVHTIDALSLSAEDSRRQRRHHRRRAKPRRSPRPHSRRRPRRARAPATRA